MWARDPDTGATNALYANVPNHPDEFNGADNLQFSADWPGYVRAALDDLNGGTSVIAAGTLGRQEPPGDVNDYSEVIPQGQFVVNAIQRAMAKATPLTDDTVAGTESYMDTLADNDDLLAGIGSGRRRRACIDAFEICTIPRSKTPRTSTTPTTTSAPTCPPCGSATSSIRPTRARRSPRSTRRSPIPSRRPLDERRRHGRRHARLLLPARQLHRPAVRLERFRALQRRPGPGQDNADLGPPTPRRSGSRRPPPSRCSRRTTPRSPTSPASSSIPTRSSRRIPRSASTDRRPSRRTALRPSSVTSAGTSATARPVRRRPGTASTTRSPGLAPTTSWRP